MLAPTVRTFVGSACAILTLMCASPPSQAQKERMPLPFKIPAKMADMAETITPSQVKLHGWLGQRVAVNAANRLPNVDLEPLIAGYRKKPGSHPWIGEHIGKWLHAATLAWAYTGDPGLKAKLDAGAHELIKAQEPDGYLGTYTPDKRFGLYPGADWDVWSHKYCLIGLLTYYQYTGSKDALQACCRAADLLVRTFGPGKKSILSAGTHVGMAATSVLEPVVLLYRHTGNVRYLDFARYIVAAWDEPKGPHVLKTLTETGKVNRTANAKAYEMLSNLVGLCELTRATGDQRYLTPVLNAWKDVVANQRYITGTASFHEHFHGDHELPNAPANDIGETCVTVTWIQLNTQLLRLTGEAKYGDELERSFYNHLAAAQRPDGREWCYYTALEGTKPYGPGINCCVSSGPRGMALLPTVAYLRGKEGADDFLAVNLFEPSRATLSFSGSRVTVEQNTSFPKQGKATLTFHMNRPVAFGLRVRAPRWARPVTLSGKDKLKSLQAEAVREGWLTLPSRTWRDGDSMELEYEIDGGVEAGSDSNKGLALLTYGPFVMAQERRAGSNLPPLPALSLSFARFALFWADTSAVMSPVTGPDGKEYMAAFVPFADAGAGGEPYRVWLGAPGTTRTVGLSQLWSGKEARSVQGNVGGSITDSDENSFVVTFDGQPQKEAWFAVTLNTPATIKRLAFAHGRAFHDGGWFDASKGKPRVEIRRTKDSPWEAMGVLDTYPNTTATDAKGLKNGQKFALTLKEPIQAIAVRVVGIPASGDNSAQAFASCGELEAFAD